MTSPMPPMAEDPAVLAGQQLQRDYPIRASALRGDFTIGDIERSRRIVINWEQATAALAAYQSDLQARRRARLDAVASAVPMGPAIAEDASQADEQVIMSAWRAALAAARDTDSAGRARMLDDAERFMDEVGLRAALTAAYDLGEVELLDAWADRQDPAMKAGIVEWRKLSATLAGNDAEDSTWRMAAFMALPKPAEASALPGMVNTWNAATVAHNRGAGRGVNAPARDVYDVVDLLTLKPSDTWFTPYPGVATTATTSYSRTPETWWYQDPWGARRAQRRRLPT